MHAKFQVAGFQNKRDIRNRLFTFTRTFTGVAQFKGRAGPNIDI